MDLCEIYQRGRAYSQFFPANIREDLSKRSGYKLGNSEVLCPVRRIIGKCPYGKEAVHSNGNVVQMFDGTDVQKSICISKGVVEKAGLIDSKNLEEKTRQNPEKIVKFRAL